MGPTMKLKNTKKQTSHLQGPSFLKKHCIWRPQLPRPGAHRPFCTGGPRTRLTQRTEPRANQCCACGGPGATPQRPRCGKLRRARGGKPGPFREYFEEFAEYFWEEFRVQPPSNGTNFKDVTLADPAILSLRLSFSWIAKGIAVKVTE